MGKSTPKRKKHGYYAKSWFCIGFDELRRRLRTKPDLAIAAWEKNPEILRCRVAWLLASDDGQGHEIARKLLKRALQLFLYPTSLVQGLKCRSMRSWKSELQPPICRMRADSQDRMDLRAGWHQILEEWLKVGGCLTQWSNPMVGRSRSVDGGSMLLGVAS